METGKMLKIDQRARRATLFANQIAQVLQDFLPQDRDIQRHIHDHLAKQAYDSNSQIVSLPPEYDKLTELKAERAMLDKIMAPILVPVDSPDDHE